MKKFDFDFYKNRRILFGISIGLMVIGLIFNFIRGTKMDIQFVGGAMIKYSVDGEVDTDEIASLVKEETGRDVSVALSKTFGTDANQVTLSFAGNEAVTLDEQQAIAQSLSDAYADRTFNVVESSSVDPTMGAKFFQKCLVCLLITFVILLVYIALRFKKIGGLSAGVTALIAQTRAAMRAAPDSLLWEQAGGSEQLVNGRTAFDAMRRGDASAKAVVDGYVHYLCVGITSIVNIFQPEVLCVGGGISREGEAVMAPVRAYVGKYGYARGSAKQPRIVAASLAGDAGIIGAALLGTEKK